MKRILALYGLGAGAALIGLTIINEIVLGLGRNPQTLRLAEVVGYGSIVLSTSLIYFAVRRYRDTVLGGGIRFGRALLTGLFTDLVASALYGSFMVAYFRWIAPDFPAQYMEMAKSRLRASSLSAEEVALRIAEMDAQAALYLDPWFQGLVMFATVFVIGAVVALVSAALLRRAAA